MSVKLHHIRTPIPISVEPDLADPTSSAEPCNLAWVRATWPPNISRGHVRASQPGPTVRRELSTRDQNCVDHIRKPVWQTARKGNVADIPPRLIDAATISADSSAAIFTVLLVVTLVISVVTAVAYTPTPVVIVVVIIVSMTNTIVAENDTTDAALIAASIAALCVRSTGKNQHAEEQKKEPEFVHVVTPDSN